jgi:hypothetical protein
MEKMKMINTNDHNKLVEGKSYTFKVGLTSLKGEAWYDSKGWFLKADGGGFYPVESCSDIQPEGSHNLGGLLLTATN